MGDIMPIKKEKLIDQITIDPNAKKTAKTETKPAETKQASTAATTPAPSTAVTPAATAAPVTTTAAAAPAVKTTAAALTAQAAAAKEEEKKPAAAQTAVKTAAPLPPTAAGSVDTTAIQEELRQLYQAAEYAAAARVDSRTEAALLELTRAEERAKAALGSERSRVAIDEARALDNAALYASLRGDQGGIGSAQYNYIMGAAEGSRARIAAEQRQLANDTASEISSLRAKGEYEKAEALLELAQDRLGKLTELYKWSENYKLDQQKLENEISKWRAEFELKKEKLAEERSAASDRRNVAQLFEDMLNSNNPYTYLTANAGSYGISGSPTIYSEIMSEYRLWLKTRLG